MDPIGPMSCDLHINWECSLEHLIREMLHVYTMRGLVTCTGRMVGKWRIFYQRFMVPCRLLYTTYRCHDQSITLPLRGCAHGITAYMNYLLRIELRSCPFIADWVAPWELLRGITMEIHGFRISIWITCFTSIKSGMHFLISHLVTSLHVTGGFTYTVRINIWNELKFNVAANPLK